MSQTTRFALRYMGAVIPLPPGPFLIGRAADAALRIDRAEISRQHAALHVTLEHVEIEDLNSINGVLVNGALLEGRRALTVGDRIVLGSVEIELASAAEIREPDDDSITARLEVRPCPGCSAKIVVTLESCPACGASMLVDDSRVTQPALLMPSMSLDEGEKLLRTLQVIFTRIDRSLARGRAVEANALAHGPFTDMLERLRGVPPGSRVDPRIVRGLHDRSLRLASALWSAKWCTFAIDVLAVTGGVPAEHALDRLEELLPGNERALKPALDALVMRLEGATRTPEDDARVARLKAIRDTCNLLLPV